MIIKRFIEFIDESYLGGSRQPLYHLTGRLQSILLTDLLKCGKPSRPSHGNFNSISLTRNIDYGHDGSGQGEIIELDSDKLRKAGIKSYPVDELSWGKDAKRKLDSRNLSKSGFDSVKSGLRGTKHNLDLPKEPILETEFEERIYQDITDLGKYLISLNFVREPGAGDFDVVKNYIVKYPHIKIYLMDKDNRRKKTDITYKFVENKNKITI